MENLKKYLDDDGCRGAVRSAGGTVRIFRRRGVIDLFTLLTDEPEFVKGGIIADKVIGRGAAFLLVEGKIAEVYAHLISTPALDVLNKAGIPVTYSQKAANIINREGTDICPVEKLTASASSPSEAYTLIKNFLKQ